jgi:hypothetical protein
MNKTHFARWSDQDQKRRDENAADEKVDQWLRQQAGVATTSDGKTAPASTPRTTTTQQSSVQTRETTPTIPHTTTSTKSSRVIRPSETPAEEEEEAIY